MGCNFQMTTLPGDLDEAEVRRRFQAMQDLDRYENGHSYSGGFGMADGLKIVPLPPHVKDWRVLEETLDDICEKWGPAQAVRFEDQWVIAANCAC